MFFFICKYAKKINYYINFLYEIKKEFIYIKLKKKLVNFLSCYVRNVVIVVIFKRIKSTRHENLNKREANCVNCFRFNLVNLFIAFKLNSTHNIKRAFNVLYTLHKYNNKNNTNFVIYQLKINMI